MTAIATVRWSDKQPRYRSDVHEARPTKRVRTAEIPTRVVFAKELTEGAKLGPVSATYAAQETCPNDCVLRGAGCYAETGPMNMLITKRLNSAAGGVPLVELAQQEADAIDGLTGERDLRLHVVGDSTTVQGTEILAAAAERFMRRGGRRVWTYTHAWRTVPRSAWGAVSVLASCETEDDVIAAQARGYATSVTMDQHNTAALHADGALNVLPCPEQTRGVTCATCQLCCNDGWLREKKITIAFAVHGDNAARSRAMRSLGERRAM